ncbi:MAG: ParA family protein [Anaerolineaceae bacterium]|nr:ParA family protein [Anaerolineaceae bacterium]MCB9101354.1 ParA family protein [Anaerolineales bacterium]
MRKIAIVGFKGGIGKTTTCISLGAALALRGHKVLLLDTDTQANLTVALGLPQPKKSLADVLVKKAMPEEVILSARKNLDLLPSSLSLFKAQQRMVFEMAREEIFEEIFSNLTCYDYMVIDCAPSLSLLTVNSIVYADEIFIPVSMEMLALTGAEQFIEYLKEVARVMERGADIRLIIPTMYDPRRRVSDKVMQLLGKLGPRVTQPIRVDTMLSEAPGEGQTIYEYAPRSRGAIDYARLAETVATLPPLEKTNNYHSQLNQPTNGVKVKEGINDTHHLSRQSEGWGGQNYNNN